MVHIYNALGGGGQFEDMIALEDFIEKRAGLKEGLDFTLYCRRDGFLQENEVSREYSRLLNFYVYQRLDIDQELEEVNEELDKLEHYQNQESESEEMTEEKKLNIQKKQKLKETRKKMTPIVALKSKKSDLEEKREEIRERYQQALSELKEIRFIEEIGMEKEMALKLDIKKRKDLENHFPELSQFFVMVFKPDSSIQRKAFIYHRKENEKEYMECMRRMLNSHNRKFFNPMNSKIKFSFKGKYIVKITKHLYQNFNFTIQRILDKHKIKSNIIETNLKTELHLHGNESNPRNVQQAYEEIIELLKTEEFFFEEEAEGQGKKDAYQYFALFHSEGDNLIQKLNNGKTGQVLIETNYRMKKITIRGVPKEKKEVKEMLRQ